MSSQVISNKEYDEGNCKVCIIHVKITDSAAKIKEVFDQISDTSWIDKLDVILKPSFKVAAERTIKELAENIFNGSETNVTKDTGEYVISVTAVNVLHSDLNHTKLPISELWKEQVKGNPGFDFHTISPSNMLVFGEAKFSTNRSPYSNALEQIAEDFIPKQKDVMDLERLERFVGVFPIQNFNNGFKSYAAAFSINAKDCQKILENAASSDHAKTLMDNAALYLIGVEIAG